jgi:hypothetical protein
MQQTLLAIVLAILVPGVRAVTFEEAKADASKRKAWLGGLLDAKVHDKAKNPKGDLKAWFYVADAEGRKAAEDAVRAEYKAEGREFYFEREVKAIFAPIESGVRPALPWYRDSIIAGSGAKAGLLLVGDVFKGSEDEARSAIEDYALAYVALRENGLKVEDQELDANIPALKNVSNKSLLPLWAQAGQLEAALKGTRKVGEAYKAELQKQYLATHQVWSRMFAHEKKVYDDNNENTLQKEIVDFLDLCFKGNLKRLEGAGVVHKLVSKDTHEYSLEKK